MALSLHFLRFAVVERILTLSRLTTFLGVILRFLGLAKAGTSRTQANKWMKNAEAACAAAVEKRIAPALVRIASSRISWLLCDLLKGRLCSMTGKIEKCEPLGKRAPKLVSAITLNPS